MPDPISETAQGSAGSAATALEGAVWDALGLRDAVEGARLEAVRSGLPGVNDGGPGDAYRHLLIIGEMKRRFGRAFANRFAAGHEFVNELTGSQNDADEQMDNHNNALGATAPELATWEDVVVWARGKIEEAAPHDGDGRNDRALWYNKQPPNWRPDFSNVPITPIEKGGPEHRYEADGDATPDEVSPSSSTSTDPLDRPVGSWTEEDVRTATSSPAYLRSQHVDHERAQRLIRTWFEQRFGTGSVQVDATGRMIPKAEAETGASSGGCLVEVRAHTRDAGKIEVRKHCRSSPAAA